MLLPLPPWAKPEPPEGFVREMIYARYVDRERHYAQYGMLNNLLDMFYRTMNLPLTFMNIELYWTAEPYFQVNGAPSWAYCMRGQVETTRESLATWQERRELPPISDYKAMLDTVRELIPDTINGMSIRRTSGAPWRALADEVRRLRLENERMEYHLMRMQNSSDEEEREGSRGGSHHKPR